MANPELETALMLSSDLGVKQITDLRYRSLHTIEGRCTTIYGALSRMFALGLIKREQLIAQLPVGWQQYIIA